MHSIRYLGVGLLFLLGCQAMPTVTRTGDVKDLIIGDDLAAAETFVNAGDEVRWVNKRTAPVRLVFLDPVSDKQLSCKNHIGGWMTPNDTARLATNETASACFRDAGQFRYTVRMDSSLTTGEINVPGVIQVGGQGGQAVDQTHDQRAGRSSGHSGIRNSAQPTDRSSGPPSSTSTTTTTTTMPSR